MSIEKMVSAVNERVGYWLDLADYDIETAMVMLNGGRYLYVGFMCHQTIEKAIKAIIARDCGKDEIPPKIHDLSRLAVRAKLIDAMSEEQQDFMEELNPLNIEARYPEYKEYIAKTLTPERCKPIIAETEKLLCWIKAQL
ncbi:MAG: HEPN domain-containing protein [Peptococcaceae bacterium]|jgi:HEPN domain-containing protein|nr:HEPN domain-containing protein [Peptococcaceae bacterium]